MYSVYLVRCRDGSLYCGITTDIVRRVDEHNSGVGKAAAYTKSRRPVQLVYQENVTDRSTALKREYAIKQLSKEEKEKLVISTSSPN